MALSEDDIYLSVHRTTWKRRTLGLMAGATLGLGVGALLGVLGACVPAALLALGVEGATAGAAFTMAAAAKAVLGFAGVGAFTGIAIGTDAGAAAGATTAMMNLQTQLPGNEKERENLEQLLDKTKPKGPNLYFNWRTALIVGAMFAVFGAILAPLLPATVPFLLGIEAGSTAATIGASALMGLMGASLGFNAPLITAKISNAYEKIVTGKVFETKQALAPDAPKLNIAKAPAVKQFHATAHADMPENEITDAPAQSNGAWAQKVRLPVDIESSVRVA